MAQEILTSMDLQTTFQPETVGAFADVPMATYQAAPGLSFHAPCRLRESPADYDAWRRGLIPDEPTPAMRYGAVLHAKVLGGDADFYTRPDTYGPENKPWHNGAAECKAWNRAHTDRLVLSASDAALLAQQVTALRTHYRVVPLLGHGRAEVSIFARADDSGKLLKGRPDYIADRPDGVDVIDLKSAVDASTRGFSTAILYRRYHLQAAMYRLILGKLGVEMRRFIFIALQKGDRPKINVRQLAPAAIDLGEQRLREDIDLYMQCTIGNRWPTWADEDDCAEIQTIDLPPYCYGDKDILEGMTPATAETIS